MSKRNSHLVCLGLLTAVAFLVYTEIFRYDTFGPEFPLFYYWNSLDSFREMLRGYTYLDQTWYRPTEFGPLYWVGRHFIAWHNLAGWKFFHFWTILATGYAVYWLTLVLLPGRQLGALLAALFFLTQPSLYPFAMEASSFDFLHILLTVMCVGFFVQAVRRGSAWFTAASWICFAVALTAKEMTLPIPFYLVLVSLVFGSQFRREALRLLPFFALLPVYYFVHVAKIPPSAFPANGIYRLMPAWGPIGANLRKFPLWVARIYCFTNETLSGRMYKSNFLTNAVGIGLLLLVVGYWIWKKTESRGVMWLMIAWVGMFLAMPIYSGGFIWHCNLADVGYCVLCGVAVGGVLKATRAGIPVFLLAWILLARRDLNIELYHGTHTTGFQINHALLKSPPLADAKLGSAPLIFEEDRLGMGGWWYGCYGNLFNFVYLRHDIKETIVPKLPEVSAAECRRWLAYGNSFFFRYDEQFVWHDATEEFRKFAQARVNASKPPL